MIYSNMQIHRFYADILNCVAGVYRSINGACYTEWVTQILGELILNGNCEIKEVSIKKIIILHLNCSEKHCAVSSNH